MKVITVGKFKLEAREKPPTVICPLCRVKGPPEWQVENRIKVVKNGEVVGSVREVIAECCSRSYLVSE